MQTDEVMRHLKLKCAAYAHADAATEVEKAVQRGELPEGDWRNAVEEILADLPAIILEKNAKRRGATMTHTELLAAIEAELARADWGHGKQPLVKACRCLLVVWEPEPEEGWGNVLAKTLAALKGGTT